MENNILNGENSENLNQENSSFFDEKVSSSNSNEENIPQLNFDKKNKQSWEIIQFSKLFSFLSNNTLSRNELTEDGNIKNIHYGDILVKYGDCVDVSNEKIPYIKSDIKLSDNIKFLNNGDVIIADTAEDTTVGKAIEVYNVHNNKIVSGLHTFACRPNFKFANKYLGYYLNSSAYHNQLLSIMQGIKVLSISKSNIGNTQIMFPKEEYQQKIADFLSLVDKRINKQRQLVESLKKYKRGLFEQIFKEYGTTSVKINDLLIEKNEKSKINNEYEIISSTKQGLFLQSEYFNKQAASENTVGYKILRKNQVVFSPQNLWMGNINFNSDFEIGIVSPSYKIYDINPDYNAYFVGLILKSSKALKEYVLASEQGASIVRRNLNIEMFNEITLKFPDKNLQNKLANYMKSIEKHLSNQEKSLNNILKLKQGLLQQMFI